MKVIDYDTFKLHLSNLCKSYDSIVSKCTCGPGEGIRLSSKVDTLQQVIEDIEHFVINTDAVKRLEEELEYQKSNHSDGKFIAGIEYCIKSLSFDDDDWKHNY
jgi:hypothetical protein